VDRAGDVRPPARDRGARRPYRRRPAGRHADRRSLPRGPHDDRRRAPHAEVTGGCPAPRFA
jgi:hypothetical protein